MLKMRRLTNRIAYSIIPSLTVKITKKLGTHYNNYVLSFFILLKKCVLFLVLSDF